MSSTAAVALTGFAMLALSCGGRTELGQMALPILSESDAGVGRDGGPGDPRADEPRADEPRADATQDIGRDSSLIGYALTVTTTMGPGTVTSSPAGIDCGRVCAATFAANTVVVLTAKPDATTWFAGWHGACAGTSTCVVTMDAAKSVEAQFYPIRHDLTVTTVGAGTVSSSLTGFTCGGNSTCTVPVIAYAEVSLTAEPHATSSFAGWSGACSGTGGCVVIMSTPQSVTAHFVAP